MTRPSTKTQSIVDEICERLSEGEPLRQICRDEHMPAWRTVYDWMADGAISARIARARDLGYDAIAEEILEIADDGRNDYIELLSNGEVTGYKVNAENIQRAKLRVETRLKLLAKWCPKRYGDKQEVTHTGEITTITRRVVKHGASD